MSTTPLEIKEMISQVTVALDQKPTGAFADVDKLLEVQAKVSKSWSGSWFGYHSRVYYSNLESPPPGAHFSSEWGLQDMFGQGSRGDWVEYGYDSVYAEILDRAENPDLSRIKKWNTELLVLFESVVRELEVIFVLEQETDQFYKTLLGELASIKVLNEKDYLAHVIPKKHSTRDGIAGDKILTPPHIKIFLECMVLKSAEMTLQSLLELLQKTYSYAYRKSKAAVKDMLVGTNVFIGHGRSHVWRDLKDFVTERLGLPHDEFNRVPVAGITNIARLNQMLDSAAVAFVVMTAEDEQADGKVEARTNVIHEVGLFQGRLGFTKAIVLLEEGCEEFSNIQGLGQIRFPKGDIRAKFEDIRQVLEREGLLKV
jgi:predicted nucleotide-binding protein